MPLKFISVPKIMKKAFFASVAALVIPLFALQPAAIRAADFQVDVKRLSVTQCSMTGSLLNIDPNTGNVSIELVADASCYPTPVNQMASSANMTVVGATTVGGGQTGQGSVNLQLNTGLPGVTNGVTCVPDGVTASNVTVVSGWTSTLCTNCGATASRTVVLQNGNNQTNGTNSFKAKCTYQDPGNANLQTVRSNIQSAPTVTVLPGVIPQPDYCESVTELAVPNGLTDAMRQLTGTVTGGLYPGTGKDFTIYTAVWGFANSTYVAGDPDSASYGFPGDNRTNVQLGLERSKYVSFRFRAPSNPVWNNRSGHHQVIPGAAFTLASIGKCPGQFASDPAFPMNAACNISGKGQDLVWTVTSGTTGACKLEPGETYYFNVIQAQGAGNLTTPTCASSLCTFKVNITGTFP